MIKAVGKKNDSALVSKTDRGDLMSKKKSHRCEMTKLEQGIFAHEERKECVALK